MVSKIDALEARVVKLESTLSDITILTDWQIKVVVITSKAVTGVGVLIVGAISFTGVVTAWNSFKDILK
ncbi:MAG: hypothetical protein COA96_15590 [SAR86 cluster bacterium]|uniref:Uncharacterized protein n=1 Tax=SAR86 cluster bacterium TaxID=2030880 RepID=A0A2A5AQ53_9GAMM|nr:MAG: hypothetical protein COA96_15590 [SAR86 cluster bacterium]